MWLGTASAVGGGIFVALTPAADHAGRWLVPALLIAAVTAALTAVSAVHLATSPATDHGTYREVRGRLGIAWGHLGSWALALGTMAACATLALGVGTYLLPDARSLVGVVVVIAALLTTSQGLLPTPRILGVVAASVVAVLTLVVLAVVLAPPGIPLEQNGTAPVSPRGALTGAALLCFLFFGYGRVLESRESTPLADEHASDGGGRTGVRRAIAISLVAVTLIYAAVTLALVDRVGFEWLATRDAAIADAAEISGWAWSGVLVRPVAAVAAVVGVASLLPRTAHLLTELADARHLPRGLANVSGSRHLSSGARMVAAGAVAVTVVLADVEGALALSSFGVLVYAGIAHASAWRTMVGPLRLVPVVGALACAVMVLSLPVVPLVWGGGILALAALMGWVGHVTQEDSGDPVDPMPGEDVRDADQSVEDDEVGGLGPDPTDPRPS